jgi:hypothetical protein
MKSAWADCRFRVSNRASENELSLDTAAFPAASGSQSASSGVAVGSRLCHIRTAMAETLLDKIWRAHTVRTLPSGQTQLLIGLHLVHEVTAGLHARSRGYAAGGRASRPPEPPRW